MTYRRGLAVDALEGPATLATQLRDASGLA